MYFLAIFIIINPILIWWHTLYVARTVHPLSYPTYATNSVGMQQQFTGIAVLGCILIIVNAFVGGPFLILLYAIRPQSLWTKKILFWLLFLFMATGFIFATLVQFVSPFLTSKLVWKNTYKGACDGMSTRVYLDSAPGQPARDVEFVDMMSSAKYSMRMEPDPNASWGFDEGAVYNFTVLPGDHVEGFVQKWDKIMYDLGAKTFDIMVEDKSILRGRFGLGESFSIPVLGMRGNLSPYGKSCVFDPTADIYNGSMVFDHGKGEADGLIMRTVQFSICDRLQVCAKGSLGGAAAVPVGLLILQRAGRGVAGKGCCKGGYLPGLEGRA